MPFLYITRFIKKSVTKKKDNSLRLEINKVKNKVDTNIAIQSKK